MTIVAMACSGVAVTASKGLGVADLGLAPAAGPSPPHPAPVPVVRTERLARLHDQVRAGLTRRAAHPAYR